MNLSYFSQQDFYNSLKQFFSDLHIPVNPVTEAPDSAKSILSNTYNANNPAPVMFPVAPAVIELPLDYAEWLGDLKKRIQAERLRVVLASNAAMVLLYWEIGKNVLKKQTSQGWGAK